MATTNPKRVLLVLDIQQEMIKRVPDPTPLLGNISAAIAGARAAGIPVIYAVLGFRAGYPEMNPANTYMGWIVKSGGLFTPEHAEAAIHPAVAPLPGEVIVTKKRYSAFVGSDLEMNLRAMQAEELIIAGVSTSAVVLSTVREAGDKDFAQIVLADSCADADPEVHDFVITKILPKQARVVTTKEWLATLKA